MTVRNPLVLIPGGNPQIQELPAGDTIGGASQGPVGMTYQGAWSSVTSYNIDDVVTNNGSSWIAIAASTNQTPPTLPTTSNTYWSLVAAKGDTGATGATGATGPTGPAGAGGDYIKLATVTTASSQATVDFSTIASTYGTIKVLWTARDTQTGTSGVSLRLKINNDGTAANYSSSLRIVTSNTSPSGASQASSTKGVQVALIPQDGNTTGLYSTGEITIVNYAGSTLKRLIAIHAHEDATNVAFEGINNARWSSTSAINELTFSTDGTAFKDGSKFTLYGIN